jgi:AraC-like DNA-binding protein
MGVDYHALEQRTLWRVTGFAAEERRPAGSRYWFENRSRQPADEVVFQLTVAGTMRFRDRSGETAVGPGQAALFRFGEDSAYGLSAEDRDDYVCSWANFDGAGLRQHWEVLQARHGSVIAIEETTIRAFRRLLALAEPRADSDPLTMADAVHQFIVDLLRGLGRDYARSQPPVERPLDELMRRPTQPWSLKEVAERFGCSREHLTRVFTHRVGVPPATWVNRQRVDKALRLLRETNLAVGSVAEQSGFASAHTLARQVRETTGKSPRAWRRG